MTLPSGVAGTTVPAFVERAKPRSRCRNRRAAPSRVAGTTVPAFVERSIARTAEKVLTGHDRVAGTTVPAFVERLHDGSPRWLAHAAARVSPGLRSRPSLSVEPRGMVRWRSAGPRVAGTTVPAFVERSRIGGRATLNRGPAKSCRRDYGPGLR